MPLNASLYLYLQRVGLNGFEIPLALVGVGGTQMFHMLSLLPGVINANPYQLGMVTVMGSPYGEPPHTLVGTGVDNRTAGGTGTLVLVSPTTVNLGIVGTLGSLATLTIHYNIPEPATALLLGSGLAALVVARRRRRAV